MGVTVEEIEALSANERRLSEALAMLRRVTAETVDDDAARIGLYLDSIEVELERINGGR